MNPETSSGRISLIRAKKKLKQGVYIVPSMLTGLSLFSGFFSIIHVFQTMVLGGTDFSLSAYAIVASAILDGLDGRVARMMKVESEFGVQFDSIADVVAFGVAPAVLIFASCLVHLGQWGWFGSFMFLACAGIRLARFNVAAQEDTPRKYFKGMPSPVAAVGLSLTALLSTEWLGMWIEVGTLVYTICLALLMVSNVRFRTFKDLGTNKERPWSSLIAPMIIFALIFSFKAPAVFVMFVTYLVWGLVEEWILFKRKRQSDPQAPFVPFGE